MTNKFLYSFFAFISIVFFGSCSSVPNGSFIEGCIACPDYAQAKYWAALPTIKDSADAVPLAEWNDEQASSPADVFFIHPTTYTGKSGQDQWNADVNDEKVNHRTDKYPIRYQASIFNGAGKVYAPRYRQAHLNCFYTMDKKEGALKALDLAYEDVSNAFQYYLEHYNNGRPFIIASHSQGTYHASRLIKEKIEGTGLQERMVVAYLPGLPVPSDYFKSLKPCLDEDDTGCFCSWRTVREGALPSKMHFPEKNIVVTNPVTWKTIEEPVTKEKQMGAVLRDFNTVIPQLVSAQVYEDFLWVSKPRFPGSFLLMTKNYHIADYNFFYADIRHNAQVRIQAYMERALN
ncbi:MAG: DUF3089 domain-containing protein [Saprospiraceae bacterium]